MTRFTYYLQTIYTVNTIFYLGKAKKYGDFYLVKQKQMGWGFFASFYLVLTSMNKDFPCFNFDDYSCTTPQTLLSSLHNYIIQLMKIRRLIFHFSLSLRQGFSD